MTIFSRRYLPLFLRQKSVSEGIGGVVFIRVLVRLAYGSVTAAEADTARAIVARIQSGDLKGDFLDSHARRARSEERRLGIASMCRMATCLEEKFLVSRLSVLVSSLSSLRVLSVGVS